MAVLLLGRSALRADEIICDTQRYDQAVVRNFDGEFLIFSDVQGTAVAKRLSEVLALYVDSTSGLDEFNRGERARRSGDAAAAADHYEKALGRSRAYWKHLIRARLIEVCDAAGQLDRAVQAFIEFSQSLPEQADANMPTQIAKATAEVRARALDLLTRALPGASGQAAYWQLEVLRLAILEHAEHGDVERVAREIVNQLQADRRTPRYRLQMIAIRVEVKHRQYGIALEHSNTALADADPEYLPELLFLKGQCLFGLAVDREGYIRAGLAFMRGAIHYPKSKRCARSLYWAGQVHERINRPSKALELYRNCQELAGADDDTARLAAAAVARLQAGP